MSKRPNISKFVKYLVAYKCLAGNDAFIFVKTHTKAKVLARHLDGCIYRRIYDRIR